MLNRHTYCEPSKSKKCFLPMLMTLALICFSAPPICHAAPSTTSDWVPNESLVASASLKEGAQVQLSRRANPQSGESFYSLYLISKDAKGQMVRKRHNTNFHLKALQNPKPLRFEVNDANRDGQEELFILLRDDTDMAHAALLSWSGKTLSLKHQTVGNKLTFDGSRLAYSAYDFNYGLETQVAYTLSPKGSLTLEKDQCYRLGVRLGISYEDFKALLGSSSKKQYLDTNEKNAPTRRFLIKSSYGQFTFEGPKLEGGNTPYTLVEMSFTAKGLQTLGGLAPGDRLESLSAWLDQCQRSNLPLLSSHFLAKEVLVKTNLGTVSGQTEVWHFKHQNGILTEIRCELE